MPANSAKYQKRYRQKHKQTRRNVTVSMSGDDRREIERYAKAQDLKLSTMLREAALHQLRGSQMHSKRVEEELKELRFLVSGIANDVEKMSYKSTQLKQVVDDNAVLSELQKLDTLIVDFTASRLKPKP